MFKHIPPSTSDAVYGIIIIHEKYDYKKFKIILMDKDDIDFFDNMSIDDWYYIIGGDCNEWLNCIGRGDLCGEFEEPKIIVQGFYEWGYNGRDYSEFIKFLNEGTNAISISRQVPNLPDWIMNDIKVIVNRSDNKC